MLRSRQPHIFAGRKQAYLDGSRCCRGESKRWQPSSVVRIFFSKHQEAKKGLNIPQKLHSNQLCVVKIRQLNILLRHLIFC